MRNKEDIKKKDPLDDILASSRGNALSPTGKDTAPATIPPEILERLAALGEDLAQFPESIKNRGKEFFLSFLKLVIEKREQQIALFREWSPKLREFTVSCRSHNPCPALESLTNSDRVKLSIYEEKISKAERLRPRRNTCVTICSIPLIGIPIALRMWPGNNGDTLILTPEELSQWCKIYKHPEEAHWWWIRYWWKIDDRPDPKSIRNRDKDLTVPDGTTPWLAESGLRWGPMAGGSTTELWSWDGTQAKIVREVSRAQF